MLACFLLVHNRMAQVKANKTEANTKGFLGSLNEAAQKSRPGAREELLGWVSGR